MENDFNIGDKVTIIWSGQTGIIRSIFPGTGGSINYLMVQLGDDKFSTQVKAHEIQKVPKSNQKVTNSDQARRQEKRDVRRILFTGALPVILLEFTFLIPLIVVYLGFTAITFIWTVYKGDKSNRVAKLHDRYVKKIINFIGY